MILTKPVRKSGHSLTILITRELKQMGLNEGDYVKVTLEKVEKEEDTL